MAMGEKQDTDATDPQKGKSGLGLFWIECNEEVEC